MTEFVAEKSPISSDLISPSSSGEPRRPKRPDRKRFQSELDRLNNGIKLRESELKSLQGKSNPETFQNRLRFLRNEKEETIVRRRQIDEKLLTVNKEITNKRDILSRIHSTLKYKSEEWINEAIKRLEYQLRVHNFKLKEEKTIVKEIDSLNRSRRSLREYLTRKMELDAMAKEQEGMRNERDALFKKVNSIKMDEEKVKKEHNAVRSQSDKLKQELDNLYRQKRNSVREYTRSNMEYNQHRAEQRQLSKKTDECKERHNCRNEPTFEKFSEELQLCDTLLTYLQRFENKTCCSAVEPCCPSLETFESLSEGTTPVSTPSTVNCEADGRFLLRKKDEEWYCVGPKGAREKRNTRQQKKRQLNQQKKKFITHTPEVFSHFEKLSLTAPKTSTEVPATLEQLKAKKKYLQHLATSTPEATSPDTAAEFPLYSFAQDTTLSPDSSEDAKETTADNSSTLTENNSTVDTETIKESSVNENSTETLKEEEPKKPKEDYKQKRATFRLSLQKCEPSVSSVSPLFNGTCKTANKVCDIVNGYCDENGNLTDSGEDDYENRKLVFQKKDSLSVPCHSPHLNMEVK